MDDASMSQASNEYWGNFRDELADSKDKDCTKGHYQDGKPHTLDCRPEARMTPHQALRVVEGELIPEDMRADGDPVTKALKRLWDLVLLGS